MRGPEQPQTAFFSYLSVDDRIPQDHPLRAMRQLVDPILSELSPRFAALYSELGRPSIPPEYLLRALLLQILYTIRSERQLMEQLNYNLLFRWFGARQGRAIYIDRCDGEEPTETAPRRAEGLERRTKARPRGPLRPERRARRRDSHRPAT